MRKLIIISISFVLFSMVVSADQEILGTYQNDPIELTENQKIDSLFNIIYSMHNAEFYRNGIYYDCKKAVSHLKMKIRNAPVSTDNMTAKQFIKYVASESSFTGIDYKIRFDNGTEITSREFLTNELEKIENSQN